MALTGMDRMPGAGGFGQGSDQAWRYLESVDLLDGTTLAGEADRRGAEELLLGGERFWGMRVIEVAPASAWLSSFVAARCAEFTVLDQAAPANGGDGVRAGWWHAMQALGLEARVVSDHAAPDSRPGPGYDVALLFGALSRSTDPLETLRRAAELSDDTVLLIEPGQPEENPQDGQAARMTLLPGTADIYRPRWTISPTLLEALLEREGFPNQSVTRHGHSGHWALAGFTTVVARRAERRKTRPVPHAPARQATNPAPPTPAIPPSPDLEAAQDLPLPPPADRRATVGTQDVEVFVTVGRHAFERMVQTLEQAGSPVRSLARVLDLGCGYSRILRWWRIHPHVEVHGTDIDVAAIAWNRERFGYGNFAINTLDPRLDYPAGSFDLVHAFGVLNHLPEHLQLPWFAEAMRVLRPGGYLYFTARGRSCRAVLPPDLQAVFDDNRLVTGGAENAGTERCVAFHPPQWIMNILLPSIGAEGIALAEHPLDGPGEDCWLIRKLG